MSGPIGIDPKTFDWMETRLKDLSQAFEDRLQRDRDFVQKLLGLTAKVCAAALVLVLGIVGFFGYKDISSIDDKITAGLDKKAADTLKLLNDQYTNKIQSFADQALVNYYRTEFSSPHGRFDRPTILPTHMERFVALLEDPVSDPKLIAAIRDLLSDRSHVGKSDLLDNTLIKMVSGANGLDWSKNNPDRLSAVIDIVRTRSVTAINPSIVRAYLTIEGVSPVLQKSAVRYLSAINDHDSLPILLKQLGDIGENPPDDILVAAATIDPTGSWLKNWLDKIDSVSSDPKLSGDSLEQLRRPASVAAEMIKEQEVDPRTFQNVSKHLVDFAARSVEILINHGIRICIENNSFADVGDSNYELVLTSNTEGGCSGYGIGSQLLLEAGAVVTDAVCKELIKGGGVGGIRKFLDATASSGGTFRAKSSLNVTLEGPSVITADLGGTKVEISGVTATLKPSTQGAGQAVSVSWTTDEGLTKTGTVSAIQNADAASFSIKVDRGSD